LMKSAELMLIMTSKDVAQKDKLGNIENAILPKNERQIRSLLENLNHNGERIKVWGDVVGSKEKITAALVQSKVDAFLDSGEVVPDIEYVEEFAGLEYTSNDC